MTEPPNVPESELFVQASPVTSRCSSTDIFACPGSNSLGNFDVRANFRASAKPSTMGNSLPASTETRQIFVSGTAVNFGTSGSICLASVTFRIPFDFVVLEDGTNAPSCRNLNEFLFDCSFVGVRSRVGPLGDNQHCSNITKLSFEENAAGGNIVFTLGDIALCKDCWLVVGGGVLFSVSHRDK